MDQGPMIDRLTVNRDAAKAAKRAQRDAEIAASPERQAAVARFLSALTTPGQSR